MLQEVEGTSWSFREACWDTGDGLMAVHYAAARRGGTRENDSATNASTSSAEVRELHVWMRWAPGQQNNAFQCSLGRMGKEW